MVSPPRAMESCVGAASGYKWIVSPECIIMKVQLSTLDNFCKTIALLPLSKLVNIKFLEQDIFSVAHSDMTSGT